MSRRWLEVLGCAAAAAIASCAAPLPSAPDRGAAAEAGATATPKGAPPAATPPAASPAEAEPTKAPAPAVANHAFHAPLDASQSVAKAPATRYASLSPAACRAELQKRGLPVQGARRAAPGVATPMQLAGSLHGVQFVAPGGKSVHGILDCRLALALDDVARILASHGVTRVRVDNFYRPSSHRRGRGRRKKSQHALGLAMDLMDITLQGDRILRVERDWRGARGEPACGPDARPADPTDDTIALRNIVCEVAREGLFHRVLTPNYDAAHESHLHLDIGRNARALVVR
jgi:hypothetical protein